MGKVFMKVIGAVSALLLSSTAWSDALPGVGSADLSTTPCFGVIVVGPPGNFDAILDDTHGLLLVKIGNAKVVESNSSRGNTLLSCHGRLEDGEPITGLQGLGDGRWGTVASNEDSCAALEAGGLTGRCRGNGKNSALIVTADIAGYPCRIPPLATEGYVETYDWQAIKTNSGKMMLTCHGYN